jgi:hypothetical protein
MLPIGVSGLFNADVYIKTLIFHIQTLTMIEVFSSGSTFKNILNV